MKKKMKTMAMALMAVATMAGFAACSSSDDDNTASGTYGKMTFDYTISEDMLNVADIKLSYLDSDGKTRKTETITTSPYHKEIIYKSLPITATDTLFLDLKSNYSEKDNYNLKLAYKVAASKVKDNQETESKKYEDSKEKTCTKAELPNMFPSNLRHSLTILGD